MNEWLERYWDILCSLYVYWGGDCSDLGPRGPGWAQGLNGKYQAEGPPAFPNAAAKSEFLAKLTALESHLASPENSLGATERQTLAALISGLRKDLGASS